MTTKVKVTVENLNDSGGLFVTPAWVSAHDGSFDLFDINNAASASLESLAEDGNVSGITADFTASGAGVDGVIFGNEGVPGIIDPQEASSVTLTVDRFSEQYFSFASMIIPSNDAFVGNDDAMAYRLFDDFGNFIGSDIIIDGSHILDAGTEQNTELDAAFLNQIDPNTGLTENGTVQQHSGFNGSAGNPSGTVNILGGTTASGDVIDPTIGDFTASGFGDLLKISFDVYNEINGTSSGDVLQGTSIDDVINADAGADIAFGGLGEDTFFGNDGDDVAFGQEGNDTLWGGKDADVLYGNIGDDRLNGEEGNDVLDGGAGSDIIRGGMGNDTIYAGAGDDVFISGGQGDDVIFGGAGNDLIAGGVGEDIIFGGSGADILYGGQDADSFHFSSETDSTMLVKDIIQDFQVGLDDINLASLGVNAASSLNINNAGAGLYEVSVNGISTAFDVQTTGGILTTSDFVLAA